MTLVLQCVAKELYLHDFPSEHLARDWARRADGETHIYTPCNPIALSDFNTLLMTASNMMRTALTEFPKP